MMSSAEIAQMTTQERLQAMEALWDALCHEKPEPASPSWHEQVLQARREEIDSGQANFCSLDEARQRLTK